MTADKTPRPKTIEFVFDFASTNAYLAYRALPDLLGRTGASVAILPCLLGGVFKATGNQAPFTAFSGVKGKLDYEMLEIRRFVQKHGIVDFRMNRHFPVNSLLAMRGLVACAPGDEFDRYLDAVIAGFWERDLPMGEAETLLSVLDEAGLEGERLLALAQTHDIKMKLAANTAAVVERGVFGAPTFFIDGEMFFGKERLGQIEDLLFSE